MTDKNKSIEEQIQELTVAISESRADLNQFIRKEGEEKAIAFLKRCKKAGLLETFIGDSEGKQE